MKETTFGAEWNSLAPYNKEPEWFKDAKLGIYTHWGPYCVPAFNNEWYPRWMYVDPAKKWSDSVFYTSAEDGSGGTFEHHRETHGPHAAFNYHDFVPLFKGERFDAKAWADLFVASGAKFAGPVAQHHDGFAMWDSEVNPWNAADKGPGRDITGELFAALRQRGLKTLATFHHARTLQRYADDPANWGGWDSHFPYHPDFATSSTDDELKYMYGNLPAEEFHDYWLEILREVIDGYAPDIIWFDWWLDRIPEAYRQRMVEMQYGAAAQRGDESVVVYKTQALPRERCVLDLEQAGMMEMSPDYWMTDITLSFDSWSYVAGQTYKPVELLVRNMIDVWSKKGIVLLNVCPRADGVIPADQRKVLGELGAWLAEHGEAVYGTRAHHAFGYGDAQLEAGFQGEGQAATIQYSANDVRFTRSKDGTTVYAFLLGLPPSSTLLELRGITQGERVVEVSLLSGETLRWCAKEDGVMITTPAAEAMNPIATVFKLHLEPN